MMTLSLALRLIYNPTNRGGKAERGLVSLTFSTFSMDVQRRLREVDNCNSVDNIDILVAINLMPRFFLHFSCGLTVLIA